MSRERKQGGFPVPNGYLKNAEMAAEGNYNMVGDGLINNIAPQRDDLTDGQTYDEMRNLAPETLPEEKQSVLEQLHDMREKANAAVGQDELYTVEGHDPTPERAL